MAKTVNYRDVLTRVLQIWVICYGAITLQIVSGYFMSHILLPYIGLALILAIIYFGNSVLRKSSSHCSMMTHYTVYILAIAGVVMLVANLLNTSFITNRYSQFSHQSYPFHASFIVYPIATIMYGVALIRRCKPYYCKACRTNAEFSITETLRRNVLHHESKVQLKLAFAISLLMTVITYVYYFLIYKSGESSRLHSPDIFFMYVLPAVAYVISVIYILTRYFSIEFEIDIKKSHEDEAKTSRIRYMVVWRDKMLLKDVIEDNDASVFDTPADIPVQYTSDIPLWEAEKTFKRFYGSDSFSLKCLFSTNKSNVTVLHCAAFLSDEEDKVNNMGGEWFTLRDMDMMLNMGVIARPFAIELHRVFTITMAWKTYDREGKRLYPIKNYRPTFRLRDFKDWDVDYEDVQWISVSQNNQDKPFYNLRRLWRRHVSGIDKRWERNGN